MNNQEIIQRVYEFRDAASERNPHVFNYFDSAARSMRRYKGPLESASREDLLGIFGIGVANVGYLLRLVSGEDPAAVAADVPPVEPRKIWVRRGNLRYRTTIR